MNRIRVSAQKLPHLALRSRAEMVRCTHSQCDSCLVLRYLPQISALAASAEHRLKRPKHVQVYVTTKLTFGTKLFQAIKLLLIGGIKEHVMFDGQAKLGSNYHFANFHHHHYNNNQPNTHLATLFEYLIKSLQLSN